MKSFLVFLSIFTASFHLFAFDKERMAADLDIIQNEFAISYAPTDWKKELFQWDLNVEINKAKEKLYACDLKNLKEYHQIIRNFFSSLKDMHTAISFYTTEYAALPFLIQGAEDRYFVTWRNEDWGYQNKQVLNIGDEVLAFNDQPLREIVNEILAVSYGGACENSFQRLAELQLTVRDAETLSSIPEGLVKVTYKKKETEEIKNIYLEWYHAEEKIINNYMAPKWTSEKLGCHPFFHKLRALPLNERWKNFEHQCSGQVLGALKSFLPRLGKVTWQSHSPHFDAYIFQTPAGKSVGYIRIPDFEGDIYIYEEFRSLINVMETRTHKLVVDVMNNPGGYAFYALAMASCLANKPLDNLKERILITQEDLFFALNDAKELEDVVSDKDAEAVLGDDICGYTVNKRLAKDLLKHTEFIKDQFSKGNYLTDFGYLEGISQIYPDPQGHYTKPLVLLINSLSISCGDVLPALLQDNQRATIVGTSSAGAGGYIIKRRYSNRFAVGEMTLTGSMIYRSNGLPLENLGVQPDKEYRFTPNDYKHKYSGFVAFLQEVLDN
jgi:hypothetical protein